jgi:hypothetical protein
VIAVYQTVNHHFTGAEFHTKTIYLSINLLFTSPMSSSWDTESTQECPIQYFETYQALMDEYEYALFESEIIFPFI